MPYVITTTMPTGGESSLAVGKRTRTAVATLDEVRREITRAVDHIDVREPWQYSDEALVLHESGGTVGPLPDGTVIEVRRATWRMLEARAGMSDHDHDMDDTAAILAAFNTA